MRVLSYLIFALVSFEPLVAGPGFVSTTVGQDPRPTLVRKHTDGSIVVAGYTWVKAPKTDATHAEFFLSRFSADGRHLSTLTDASSLLRTAVAPNGNLLAFGHAQTGAEDFAFKIRRFTPDGKPDFSFGKEGIVTNNPGPFEDWVQAVAFLDKGKFLAVGATTSKSGKQTRTNTLVLARYLEDGRLDESFGSNGWIRREMPTPFNVESMRLLTDGRLQMFAMPHTEVTSLVQAVPRPVLYYFSAGGQFQKEVAINLPPGDIRFPESLPVEDGKWLLSISQDGEPRLVQVTAEGAVDPTFGSGGYVLNDLYARGLAFSGDKVIAAGHSTYAFAAARFSRSGAIDTTFGQQGMVKEGLFPAGLESSDVVAVEPDTGKILVAATTYRLNGDPKDNQLNRKGTLVLLRLNPDGSLDLNFGVVPATKASR